MDQSVGRLLCTLAKVVPLPVFVARANQVIRPAPPHPEPPTPLQIDQLPVAHVYSGGQLVDTRALHKPPLVREFVKSLTLHADGYSM